MSRVLSVTGLHKWFGDRHILSGIDLDVARHEVVVLIGASGSGKSTLLKTINLLERVDDGQIFLGGEDITDPRIKVDDVRARIGVVFQQYNLFPHMNVLDNVTLALRKVKKLPRAAAETRGHELLERIRLADFAGRIRIVCLADSSSAWRLLAPSPPNRNCYCSTRSPRPSIRS